MSIPLSGFDISKPATTVTATAGSATGSLDATAVYGYKVTYVSQFGETDASTAATVTTTSSGSVNLTAIPISTSINVIARKLYRTIGGGSSYLLLDTIADNVTTTYTDTKIDSALGAAAPTLNTAHSLQNIDGLVKVGKPIIHSVERAITATGTTIADAYQLSAGYSWISTAALSTGVKLPELNSALIGTRIKVRNNGANTVNVYPVAGQSINGGSAGAAVTLATNTSVEFVADLATNWAQI